MNKLLAALAVIFLMTTAADARGWSSVHRYVHPTGKCHGREVMATNYWEGRRTASGERFNPNGMTAAAHDWPMGTRLRVTNPHNGRSVTVRINDHGPYGIARRMGVKLDLARGAAHVLGMTTSYVCV